MYISIYIYIYLYIYICICICIYACVCVCVYSQCRHSSILIRLTTIAKREKKVWIEKYLLKVNSKTTAALTKQSMQRCLAVVLFCHR